MINSNSCSQILTSVCVQINTEDLYEDMKEFHHELDCSNYPPNHPLYSTVNKKVLGKFKDGNVWGSNK